MKRIVRIVSAAFLGLLFVYAGADKAFHYGGFVKALGGYVLVPDGMESFLAMPLILCEILAGVGLLVPAWRRPAALVAMVMLAVFTAAIAVNQHYRPGAECGCWFTVTLGKASTAHVLQNLVLLGLAASIWLDERTADEPAPPAPTDPESTSGFIPRRAS
jgi:uncharacterized membrane protein YphA (DoxX/SURF4 family)